MESTENAGSDASRNDLLGNGIGAGDQNITVTDADVTDPGGSGDLGGGHVGGDAGAPVGSDAGDDAGVEDEDLVTDAVDDGDDIASESVLSDDDVDIASLSDDEISALRENTDIISEDEGGN